jgi:hypothetical protein
MKPSGSRPGPRLQPDFVLRFKRDAFSREQLQKLRPFIGDLLTDSTLIAATYNIYLPFFSAEVKCGAAALDIADQQTLTLNPSSYVVYTHSSAWLTERRSYIEKSMAFQYLTAI